MPDGLYPYQIEDAAWLAEQQFGFVLSEQGTGKTLIAIRAADNAGIRTNIVVIAPGLVLQNHVREFARWQTIPRTLQIIDSGRAAQDLHGDVLFVSNTMLVRILPELLAHATFGLVIVDEAQAFKNPGAKRTAALYNAKGLISNSRRMWLLSATLMMNAAHELWPPYASLLRGKLSYPAFTDRFCIVKQSRFGRQIIGTQIGRLPEITALFRPHTIRRRQADVLEELPPLRFDHVTLSPDGIPLPDLSEETLAILGKLKRDEALSVTERMHLTTLLRETSKLKAPAIVEQLEADLESIAKVVVFAVYRETIDILVNGLGINAAAIHGDTPQRDRQRIIDSFQDETRPRVLVIQLNVGSTGITLHRANHVVFSDATWTPADLMQAAKRLHRIGQTKSVLARVISLAGTIDETVVGTLTRKAAELAVFDNLLEQRETA